MPKSAIAEHFRSQHHLILGEETSVLDQASNNATLLIKEPYIHFSESDLNNRDKAITIPDCWRLILSYIPTIMSFTLTTPYAMKLTKEQWTLPNM